jgi:SAM-dependent methyltransferase
MIEAILDRKPAEPWSHGGKIPWNDPDFSTRMLREHLSQNHDRASRRSGVIAEQVAWIHQAILGGRVSRVLDLGCGPGFYTSRLAALGHSCVGIDFSPASIEYAREIACKENSTCEYLLSNLEDALPSGQHDAALLLFGELNTFPRPVAKDLLRRLASELLPGALVLLEVHTEEAVRSLGSEHPTWSAQGSSVFSDHPHLILRECSWHEAEAASVERHFIFDADSGEPSVMASTTQAYSSAGYSELLKEAGLAELHRYPCLTARPSAVDSALFVILAAKPGAA